MSGVAHAQASRIVELLGVAGALKFVEEFGGRRLYVPQPERLKPEGALVAAIGYDAAAKIAFEWRGLEIMVPRCRDWLMAERKRQIHRGAAAGMSLRELAGKYDLTERRISQLLGEPVPAEPAAATAAPAAQRDLFRGS